MEPVAPRMRSRFTAGPLWQRPPQAQLMSAAVVDAIESWDDFFGELSLRAYAGGEAGAGARAQALAAARLAGCPEGGDLLDVPCGYGRHTVPLAAAGYHVMGVDRSEVLLAEARRRAGHGRW